MVFNIKIILQLARKITIIKKSLFLAIKNIENLENILFKITNFYPITKLNGIIDFCSCRYKIMIIIFIIII